MAKMREKQKMNFKEYLSTCTSVYHTTLNPREPGVVRIHLVPPVDPKPRSPWVAIINGYSVIPLQSAWGVITRIFIERINRFSGKPMDGKDFARVMDSTVLQAREIFRGARKEDIEKDVADILRTFRDLALGKEPSEKIGYMTLAKYARHMKAPHRMDLMISAITKNGAWHCNRRCLHCYAADQPYSEVNELSTEQWKRAIDACKKAGIPAITFTGGEPTMRSDLVELVDYSQWFVTRLNTNGALLTRELCDKLAKASLDSVQITLYSADEQVHNTLVGCNGFADTVSGIKNALAAKLDVSVNTPLCSINRDYEQTVKFLLRLGVRYFSCSGLIPAGNAEKDGSTATRLSKDEITEIVKKAAKVVYAGGGEISFTSPGWIDDSVLQQLKTPVPSCGACLSNMAIAPDGTVVPCQSWLTGKPLGNILGDDWKKIWNGAACRKIRKSACKKEKTCLLKEKVL